MSAPPAAPPDVRHDPPAAIALVETDSFCDCGYNLHGQKVWRDPNLELLVCRCPECGKHSAAGRFTGIHSAWLHRLSMGLILGWILFLLALFAFLIPMLGAWPNIHMDRSIALQPLATQGQNPTEYEYVLMGPEYPQYRARRSNEEAVIAIVFGALNGLILGGAVSVFLWHLRRWRFAFVLLPLPVMALVYWGWVYASYWPVRADARAHVMMHVVGYAIFEGICIAAGIQFGRTVTRAALRVLLPNRLLQHLAFLWYRDGKVPPFQKDPAGV